MAQKINPISLRLEKTNKHFHSCWYGDYNYTTQLLQDCAVQAYMENLCQQAKIAPPVISLNRGRQQIRAFLFFPRQHVMRKSLVKHAGNFPVAGQGKDWLSETFSRSPKIPMHSSDRVKSVLSLGVPVFRHLLLSLFSGGAVLHGTDAFQNDKWIAIAAARKHMQKEKIKWFFHDQSPHAPEGVCVSPRQEFSGIAGAIQRFTKSKLMEQEKFTRFASRDTAKRNRQVATPVKNHLERVLHIQTHCSWKVHFLICPSAHQNPLFLATQVVSSLEERLPFRRLKHRLIRKISQDSGIKGVRISCSGRVAARSKKAQKARTESIQWGQTSLHVFSDFVNFASKSALTPFGKIGVKVWICYK